MVKISTLDIITTELKKQNKSQKDICEYLGTTKNTYTNWKAGKSASYKKYLPEIAEYLGVSIDYLLEKDHQTKNRETFIKLSDQEKELVYAYRKKTELQSAVNKLLDIENNPPQ